MMCVVWYTILISLGREYKHFFVKIEKFSSQWNYQCALLVYELYDNMWVCQVEGHSSLKITKNDDVKFGLKGIKSKKWGSLLIYIAHDLCASSGTFLFASWVIFNLPMCDLKVVT